MRMTRWSSVAVIVFGGWLIWLPIADTTFLHSLMVTITGGVLIIVALVLLMVSEIIIKSYERFGRRQ